MRYRIEFRKITGKDLTTDCPFVPDDREYESGFLTVMSDAAQIEGVTDVSRDGSHAIVVTSDSSLDELMSKFVPTLQSNWTRLRAIEFCQINEG